MRMKRGLLRTLALVGVGAAWLIATPIHAQTTGVGPYYATPSWDQTLPAATRFIVLSNMSSAAVLDRETGLVWERAPLSPCTNPLFCITLESGVRSWNDAQRRCRELKVGNRGGWHLPSVEEVLSLVDFDPANTSLPRLPPGHPFLGVQTSSYWTATTVDQLDDDLHLIPVAVYLVSLTNGGVGEAVKTVFSVQENVWC